MELEPDEQIMLRYMVLKRDLLKCMDMIQSCHEKWKRLKQTSGDHAADDRGLRDQENAVSGGRNDSQGWWYEEMRKRASIFIACLDPKNNR